MCSDDALVIFVNHLQLLQLPKLRQSKDHQLINFVKLGMHRMVCFEPVPMMIHFPKCMQWAIYLL